MARRRLSASAYVEGVLASNRGRLGQAITLVESRRPGDGALAQEVLRQLLPHTGRSIRVGLTGVPGVGKSTLIDTLGMQLIELERVCTGEIRRRRLGNKVVRRGRACMHN